MTLSELAQKLEELKEVKQVLKDSEWRLQEAKNPEKNKGLFFSPLEIQLQEERCESLRKKLVALENINLNSFSLDEIPF